jgi:nitrogen-specific signal transduction histidine kinase/CheY-like chemotaxis protein
VVTFLDITERRKLEEQFRQAQRLESVGRLAGGVAHDFNNSLTVIRGFANLALKGETNAQKRHDLDVIVASADRAATLTRQLLAFSRKQILDMTVVNLNVLLENVTKTLPRLIGEDVQVSMSLDPQLANVKADPVQVEQILMNLAVNARDAMPTGGMLDIATSNTTLDEEYAAHHAEVTPGPYVLLSISDNGCGMDKKMLAQIFEPFFTTKGVGKGTGLGLSTVYGIVKQHGGHVAVYSEPGRGTTFKVYLPAIAEQASEVTTQADEIATGHGTILLVEDEDSVREVGKRFLEAAGYDVLEADSAESARKIFAEHQSDVVLLVTDVVMPGDSGRALYDGLRQERPSLKVLYVSGYADEAIVHHGVLEPGTPFLQKPFTEEKLTQKVRDVLQAGPPDPHRS